MLSYTPWRRKAVVRKALVQYLSHLFRDDGDNCLLYRDDQNQDLFSVDERTAFAEALETPLP